MSRQALQERALTTAKEKIGSLIKNSEHEEALDLSRDLHNDDPSNGGYLELYKHALTMATLQAPDLRTKEDRNNTSEWGLELSASKPNSDDAIPSAN